VTSSYDEIDKVHAVVHEGPESPKNASNYNQTPEATEFGNVLLDVTMENGHSSDLHNIVPKLPNLTKNTIYSYENFKRCYEKELIPSGPGQIYIVNGTNLGL